MDPPLAARAVSLVRRWVHDLRLRRAVGVVAPTPPPPDEPWSVRLAARRTLRALDPGVGDVLLDRPAASMADDETLRGLLRAPAWCGCERYRAPEEGARGRGRREPAPASECMYDDR